MNTERRLEAERAELEHVKPMLDEYIRGQGWPGNHYPTLLAFAAHMHRESVSKDYAAGHAIAIAATLRGCENLRDQFKTRCFYGDFPGAVRCVEALTALSTAGAGGNYKAMFEDAARDLAAIIAELDMNPDKSGGAGPILDAIKALKKGGEDEVAMQRACAELPEGYGLHVCLEAGSGWIELSPPDHEPMKVSSNFDDGGMTPHIHAAIDVAVKADAEFEELNRE